MKIPLDDKDLNLLEQKGVQGVPNHNYTEDEAFALLEQVRDLEIYYAQDSDEKAASRKLANRYASIADKIQSAIPEV